MLVRLYSLLVELLQAVWAVLKSPFQSHGCKLCACEEYSDEALFMWMSERMVHSTYPDEMLSANIVGRPLKCSRCDCPREQHGTLQQRVLTCQHMPDGGRVFVEQQRRAVLDRRERRFQNATVRERRPAIDVKQIADGEGVPAKAGDVVVCHYDAYSSSTMERFETSRDGEPFRFTVAAAQVVPGWEMGVKGVKKGARRKITVPPELAYRAKEICGERNVTIIFDIQVLNIEVC